MKEPIWLGVEIVSPLQANGTPLSTNKYGNAKEIASITLLDNEY
jgi:hypothetical protein